MNGAISLTDVRMSREVCVPLFSVCASIVSFDPTVIVIPSSIVTCAQIVIILPASAF